MPYDYTPRQLDTWSWAAQAAAWRMKAEHAQQETNYWRGVAAALQARQAVAEGAEDARA